jgi:death-on-curing protein
VTFPLFAKLEVNGPGAHPLYRALGFSLIQNHAFVDGSQRIGHAAMEVLLLLNGREIRADYDQQERVILAVASGQCSRTELTDWLRQHTVLWQGRT